MKLTVIQTLPALNAGGVERGTLEVAAELVRRGHRSIVISAGGRMVEKLLEQGSEHITLPLGKKSPFTFRYIFRLRRIIRESGAHILHTRSRLPAWLSYLAWKGLPEGSRPRFITTVHGPYTVNAYSRIMTRGETVIAISEFIKDYILKNYPQCDPDNIVVVPRGVAAEEFPYGFTPAANWIQQWQQQQPQLRNKFIITLPARITRWKGQADFVEVIAKLQASGLPVHGLVAGGAERRQQSFLQELKSRVTTLGANDSITFLDHRSDLREVMGVSDVVLSLAKEPEAFGRTALEALSLGKPVIAYDHGGAHEVLDAIFAEGLVPANDINSAVDKIRSFYQARPCVPQKNPFTLEKMLNNILSLYEKSV